MLEVKNLSVEIEGKKILNGINLKLEKGKVYALMGPNGSGKSTLANVLMGNPKYNVVSGKILLNGEDITNLSVDERARKGLFLGFQNPQEVSGVSVSNFLRQAYNSLEKGKISFLEFQKLLKELSKKLNVNEEFLTRYLNEGFSGGEKKKSEILQMNILNPKIAILDEIDSGLDIDSLRNISKVINDFMNKEKSILIITHYRRILNSVEPEKIFVMIDGKIVAEKEKNFVEEIESKGYSWIKN